MRGAGSLATRLVISPVFAAKGRSFKPSDECDIGNMPSYHFVRDGEREMQAYAKGYVGAQAGQALLEAG